MPISALIKTSNSRLYALFWLRCVAIAGQTLAVLVTHFLLAMPLPLLPLFAVIGGLTLINAFTWQQYQRSKQGRLVSDEVLAAQLTIDVMALALLLYFTGGVANPFVSLFLLPLAIAAVILPVGYSVILLTLSLFLFASLMADSVPLPPSPPKNGISPHTLALWLNFVISSSLLTGFIAYLANRLRSAEQQLQQQHELRERQEQILALGTLAAGTAHELGTPLSTIAILAQELESQVEDELREDVVLLRQQVSQCKQILGSMLQKVELAQMQELTLMEAADLIAGVLEKFQILRPAIRVKSTTALAGESRLVAADATLEQALLNLLNNAADASSEDVGINYYDNNQKIIIDISDRGLGFPEEILHKAGGQIVSTKGANGMGIGLFLANATLERLGGDIAFIARVGGGVTARVILPVQRRT